jgi:hypothetical protein
MTDTTTTAPKATCVLGFIPLDLFQVFAGALHKAGDNEGNRARFSLAFSQLLAATQHSLGSEDIAREIATQATEGYTTDVLTTESSRNFDDHGEFVSQTRAQNAARVASYAAMPSCTAPSDALKRCGAKELLLAVIEEVGHDYQNGIEVELELLDEARAVVLEKQALKQR